MKQALPLGTKGHVEDDVQHVVLSHLILLVAASFLIAAFVVVGIVLYRADALIIVPTTSPIPFVIVDPSLYLPEIISLVPTFVDVNLPVPQAR